MRRQRAASTTLCKSSQNINLSINCYDISNVTPFVNRFHFILLPSVQNIYIVQFLFVFFLIKQTDIFEILQFASISDSCATYECETSDVEDYDKDYEEEDNTF